MPPSLARIGLVRRRIVPDTVGVAVVAADQRPDTLSCAVAARLPRQEYQSPPPDNPATVLMQVTLG